MFRIRGALVGQRGVLFWDRRPFEERAHAIHRA
jgi:hypothetical protein